MFSTKKGWLQLSEVLMNSECLLQFLRLTAVRELSVWRIREELMGEAKVTAPLLRSKEKVKEFRPQTIYGG